MRIPSLLVVGAVGAIPSFTSAQDWLLRTPPATPAAATFPRMAYDSQRGRCVAFGGWNAPTGSIVFDQTWEWDGTVWTQRTPATIPDERDSHAMAYDSQRGRTVMFGGWDFGLVLLGQTWEWDGTNWQNRNPANAPSARQLSAMAYDAARGVVVLFGGQDSANRADTWEWNGTNWAQRTPATSPPARRSHAMAFDSGRGRVVMFGGRVNGAPVGDTWEYDGTTWAQVATDGAPSARVDHQLVFDSQRNRCVLFGGDTGAIELDDTWEYDARGWRELITATPPTASSSMAMAYDSARGRAVVFGGYDGAVALGGTWELGGNFATYRLFGTGCVGSGGRTPTIVPIAVPSLGSNTQAEIRNLPPTGGVVYLAAGLSDQTWLGAPLPVDLTPAGLSGCRGYTSADAGALLTHTSGIATWTLLIPATPSLSGARIYLQALSFDAGAPRPFAAAMSNAAELNVR